MKDLLTRLRGWQPGDEDTREIEALVHADWVGVKFTAFHLLSDVAEFRDHLTDEGVWVEPVQLIVPTYLTDLNAAFGYVPEGWVWRVVQSSSEQYFFEVTKGEKRFYAERPTICPAIVIAAYQARHMEEE